MFIAVRPGLCQSDSINRLIQLTVIQLSGGHCSRSFHIKLKYAFSIF